MGSGPTYYFGWITAFCFWKEDGGSLYSAPRHGMKVDGVSYHRIEADEVPPGYSSVPVKVVDNGDVFDAMMVAVSVGINRTSSGDELDGGLMELDTRECGDWLVDCSKVGLAETECWTKSFCSN